MSIAVGQFALKASNNVADSTASVSTQGSDSSFLIWSMWDGTFTSIADSKSNSFSNILAQTSPSSFYGALKTRLDLCTNGTGGAGHTATLTTTGSGAIAVALIEITGGLTASLLDKLPTPAEDLSGPAFDTPSTGVLSQADELALAFYLADTASGTETFTFGNSFSQLGAVTDPSLYYCAAVGSRVVSATTAINGTTTLASGTGVLGFIATFKAAAAAAAANPGQSWQQQGAMGVMVSM